MVSPTVLTLTSHVANRFTGVDSSSYDAPLHLVIQGICDAALTRGIAAPIEILTAEQASRIADPEFQPPALREGKVHGLILCSAFNEDLIKSIAFQYPCVTIPRSRRPYDIDSVGPEHLHGFERLVLHLHKQGHRNIGFAGLEERPLWSLERYAGFLHAAKELGLQTPPGWMINAIEPAVEDSHLDEPVLEATRQGVTAWACVSDGLAHRLYCIFKNAGLRVPEDVSITGFDGIKRLKDCPALTTMEVPWKEMGEGALAAIIERINNPSATAVHREYMGKFVRGKSTAPPRED